MIKILLACETGLTSNLLVERMDTLVKGKKYDISLKAIPELQIESEINNFDMVLVSPQISKSKVEAMVQGKIAVQEIMLGDYTTVNAEHIIERAIKGYKEFNEIHGKSKELSILVACTAGISSELVVSKMQKVSKDKNLHFVIKAVPETEVENEVDNFDVLLVSPQISLQKIEKIVRNRIPVESINTGYYTTVDGEEILKQAANLYNNK